MISRHNAFCHIVNIVCKVWTNLLHLANSIVHACIRWHCYNFSIRIISVYSVAPYHRIGVCLLFKIFHSAFPLVLFCGRNNGTGLFVRILCILSLVNEIVYSGLNVLFSSGFVHVLAENVRRFLVRILRRLNSHPFSCKLIGKHSARFFCCILATLIVEIRRIDVKPCVLCNIRNCILRSLSVAQKVIKCIRNRRNNTAPNCVHSHVHSKVVHLVCRHIINKPSCVSVILAC